MKIHIPKIRLKIRALGLSKADDYCLIAGSLHHKRIGFISFSPEIRQETAFDSELLLFYPKCDLPECRSLKLCQEKLYSLSIEAEPAF